MRWAEPPYVSDKSPQGSLEIFDQSFLHRAQPKIRGPEEVAAHVLRLPLVRLRKVLLNDNCRNMP